jgi:predicted N-acyltransferase
VRIEVHAGLGDLDPVAWDALTGTDDPFVEHAFLRTLETSGSVGAGTGWQPVHVTVWDAGELVAALPLYLKTHGYGEFIFDFEWAHAAMRARIRYYPKLVSMVPFTPATGRRLLLAPGRDPTPLVQALLAGARAVADEADASSIHLLFLTAAERDLVLADPHYMPRLSCQYHWHHAGERSFDDYLGRMRSEARKNVRKERRRALDGGLRVRTLTGPELGDREWAALDAFYRDTCRRKGSEPYLAPGFFDLLRRTPCLGRVVAVLAYDGDEPVAGTIDFEKGRHLYGRYWGSLERYDALHFELCYYRLIERAIERGCTRFEAGAQGTHKIKRGLVPTEVYSAHWLRSPALAAAVADYLSREAEAVREEMRRLATLSPFRRDGSETTAT